MQAAPSCYGSMVASTSDDPTTTTISTSSTNILSKIISSTTSSSGKYIEAPAFFYDMDSDLKELKSALKGAELLNESGYQSILERSRHPFSTSIVLNDDNTFDSEDDASDEHWDGYLTVGTDRIKIKDMSDILATRYAFLSGSRTTEGLTIVTFPDSRSTLPTEDYTLLIKYLLQVPPLEESHKGFIIIVDRRSDKWSSVRTLLLQVASFFPGQVRVVFIIKPEGVLQRALEVGYRGIADTCPFKVIQLESSLELKKYFRSDQLTMDVGGLIKYNHLEWVQHRMDIERMKSSATAIAASLSDFGKMLRETELPNDVESTARILEMHTSEKDAIKEDFRISVRKGMQLLRSVRQLEKKPTAEQLSPTRLHNVTAIERMLVQLEETERSFDLYWSKHERKLSECLKLRQFEEQFRKLQAAFARHMLYLEEHREVGNSAQKAEQLLQLHQQYSVTAMEEVQSARDLKNTGDDIMSGSEIELCGSLLPKCDELERMADALTGALERRTAVLKLSKTMHEQIAKANQWCRKGVELMSDWPNDLTLSNCATSISVAEQFLEEGADLRVDSLKDTDSELQRMILMTTTDTSTLLNLVEERINDIRIMSQKRRDWLSALCDSKKMPIQVITNEKSKKSSPSSLSNDSTSSSSSSSTGSAESTPKDDEKETVDVKDIQCCSTDGTPTEEVPLKEPASIETYVLAELISTERNYVYELASLIDNYIDPFESPEHQYNIPSQIRGKPDLVFGNLREILEFHKRYVLPDLAANDTTKGICRTLLLHRNKFLALYRTYCQYKASSETLRKEYIENTAFFNDCQRRASHPLPLGAYLLKPVQRITKYQLLLKELEKSCVPEDREEVAAALSAMLDLLAQINAAIHQLHISGFNGDLRVLGPLRLQTECDIYPYNRKKKAKLSKVQRRHLFLFDGGVMFCKKRTPPNQVSSMDPEYYEHKLCIPILSLGFIDSSRSGAGRFEIWDEAKVDAFVIEPIDLAARTRWVDRLNKTVGPHDGYILENRQRPKSWASTMSNESTCSSSTRESDGTENHMDTNGNTQATQITTKFSPTEEIQGDMMDTTTNISIEEINGEVELVDSC